MRWVDNQVVDVRGNHLQSKGSECEQTLPLDEPF